MIEGGGPNDTMQQQQQQLQLQGEASQLQSQLEYASPSPSPSFSSYSSETLADIAARVINELRRHPQNDHDDDPLFQPWENDHTHSNDHFTPQNDDPQHKNDDDEFEFAFVSRDQNAASPVSADDIFCNGQIKPMYMYPLFGAPLNAAVPSASHVPNSRHDDAEASPIRRRLPLRKLMFEERETGNGSFSSSTSENDSVDLEGVPEGTYCVWNPDAVARDRKKSKSTGSSSKRWKLRELVLRSHSEGKAKKNSSNSSDGVGGDDKRGFVLGVPTKRTSKVAAAKPGSGDASAEHDGKSGKKSVLPYKHELIGLLANVNGLGRNLHPF